MIIIRIGVSDDPVTQSRVGILIRVITVRLLHLSSLTDDPLASGSVRRSIPEFEGAWGLAGSDSYVEALEGLHLHVLWKGYTSI